MLRRFYLPVQIDFKKRKEVQVKLDALEDELEITIENFNLSLGLNIKYWRELLTP